MVSAVRGKKESARLTTSLAAFIVNRWDWPGWFARPQSSQQIGACW